MPPKRKRKRPVTPAQGAAGPSNDATQCAPRGIATPCNAGPSGSGQQEDEGQGQGEQEDASGHGSGLRLLGAVL
ncbi:hypothetical protein HaLaN_32086, partial [Haematococcus lacustris]